MRDPISLIIQAESEGFDTLDEAIEYAAVLVTTGLVNSTGSNQRFVDAIASEHPGLLVGAIAERANHA